MRACNHPAPGVPTKFCAYRYRARREAQRACFGVPHITPCATLGHTPQRIDSIGVWRAPPRVADARMRLSVSFPAHALRTFRAVDSKNHYMNHA
ncbi:hypothetical protein F7R21_11550 [Burkholderia latens]|uniref:Uncharacterized protein n=1 Tax=Burkholderia latens TaxID=488446 RepID=A0A6H9SP74_9BURK|nr:hypothetical protein F7R21_11550 [Burkholderia latens]